MSTQQVDLIGHIFLASALVIAVSQIGLLWALVRRAGRRGATATVVPLPDLAVDMLEREIDQLRGELYRLRKERDWLRRECARLARGGDGAEG